MSATDHLVSGYFYWVDTDYARPVVLEWRENAFHGCSRHYFGVSVDSMVESGTMRISEAIWNPFDTLLDMANEEMLDYEEEDEDVDAE